MTSGTPRDSDRLTLRNGMSIPRGELVIRATRSGGPGGQHVNTSSSRIELLWNIRATSVLNAEDKVRVQQKLARRVDGEGWLRVVATDTRSQLRNRNLAEDRLVALVNGALHVPRRRRATRPTTASREERLRTKKIQSRRKSERAQRPDIE